MVVKTRHTSSCLFVGCANSPESLSLLSSSGFVHLPPRCRSNYLGFNLLIQKKERCSCSGELA
ncbi:hypothetical protein D6029_12725 [Buttiauxella izardii]|uniref:Uncharacterized protein n=1 Tax=Buttiauxella izardii TaxID=82991 RepID=A0A3A5JPA4_9ENTR|nr:hypothetical protein D6029_12725 [Buttiauxella izardii]